MQSSWKYNLAHGWNFMRLFRLGLAGLVLFEAWKSGELLFAGLGMILLVQSLLNVGCCGASGCDISHVKKEHKSTEPFLKEVTFEEIKKTH